MKIISEKKALILNIEYDNIKGERERVNQYLDDRFGVIGYRVKRGGPHPNKAGKGLMIVQTDL